MATATLDLSDLASDGDTLDLAGGEQMLRLRILPDCDHNIVDEAGPGVWCGLLEWDTADRYGCYPYGRRPDGFDGLARVIDRDHGRRLWWQPPASDIIGPVPWDAETMRTEEARIRDLYNYGFVGIVLELCEGADHYGRAIVKDAASLWGVEWDVSGPYLAEIVAELCGEMGVGA